MTNTKTIGDKGEEIASQYLANKGYRILSRNWQFLHRELDIVAMQNKTLVFVEVKTRAANFVVSPAEAVSKRKQKLLVEAADLYIKRNNLDFEARFDIVSIVNQGEKFIIEHIENAFYPRA
jgi:putative endonuclease